MLYGKLLVRIELVKIGEAMSKLIRIDESTLQKLKRLEKDTGLSKQAILHQAVDNFLREKILRGINDAYEALRQDPEAWKEELEERALWDVTLSDGLEDL